MKIRTTPAYRFAARDSRRRAERINRDRRNGLALLAATALGFASLFYGAARIDAANGISVSESLANNGIHGAAHIARHFESPEFAVSRSHAIEMAGEAPAVPARLVGRCNGVLMAAESESAFPAGCERIERIRL